MRLELTRKSDLALRALRALHSAATRLKTAPLAAEAGTTASFLPQVMAPLVRSGWVDSEPGPRGGYLLAAPAWRISVLDLIEAVEGPTDAGRCVLRGGPCPEAQCALHEAWAKARDALLMELARTPVVAAPPTTGDDET